MRLLSLILLVSMTQLTLAIDIHVDNLQGDDRNNGKSAAYDSGDAGPVRTITKALRVSNKGDRVVLKNTGVPYRESITFQARRNSGYPGSPFVFVGNGAVLDGSAFMMNRDWEYAANDVYRFSPRLKSYQQMFRDDKPLEKSDIKSEDQLDQLKPLEWAMFDGNMYFRAEPGKGPGTYRLTYSGLTVGITLYEVKYLRIEDLTVQGFQLDGINAHDKAMDVQLEKITARGNGRSGISVGGASRVEISDTVLGNNGAAQLRTEGYSTTKVKDTELFDTSAPAVDQQGGKLEIDGKPYAG